MDHHNNNYPQKRRSHKLAHIRRDDNKITTCMVESWDLKTL